MIMFTLRSLVDVPATDPDDARRRKLLNIILVGFVALILLSYAVTLYYNLTGLESNVSTIYIANTVALVGLTIIYVINRRWSGIVASTLFLLLLIGVLALDQPEQVIEGRTLFMFVIPVLMASVLLRPYASFIAVAGIAVLQGAIALNAGLVFNAIAIIAFVAIAIVSWLSARSLETALRELRAINRELDQRVADRTRELSEALRREQIELSKNQAILAGIADGVVVFDNAGKAILTNPAVGPLLQRPSDEVLGHDIQMLMDGKVSAADRENVLTLLKHIDLRSSSLKLAWGVRTLSASFAPVQEAGGQRIGVVAVFRDYTREAEIDRMKSSFVSIASHELRTPLNAIIGYTEILASGAYGPLADKQSAAVGRIMTNSGQLLSLVNNLLDQAQIEAGTLKLQTLPFEPAELLDDVHGVMDVFANSKGLKLTMQVAPGVPTTLFGDSQRLRQIIVNLVGNAIKFTERGEVKVDVYCPDPDHWALSVTDSGPGIPADAQAYIFEPFRQVDTSLTREQAGVGLGLSIVKQLATLMQGKIQLESKVGSGSTFTIILPVISTPEMREELL
jgi:signal transduction histidine kinase